MSLKPLVLGGSATLLPLLEIIQACIFNRCVLVTASEQAPLDLHFHHFNRRGYIVFSVHTDLDLITKRTVFQAQR